jgi:hypothetical protein
MSDGFGLRGVNGLVRFTPNPMLLDLEFESYLSSWFEGRAVSCA